MESKSFQRAMTRVPQAVRLPMRTVVRATIGKHFLQHGGNGHGEYEIGPKSKIPSAEDMALVEDFHCRRVGDEKNPRDQDQGDCDEGRGVVYNKIGRNGIVSF